MGDHAVRITLGNQIDRATNEMVHRLAHWLGRHAPPGIGEAVPGYATLLVYYDPATIDYAQAADGCQQALRAAQDLPLPAERRVDIPVRYGGMDGPDLPEVAALHGITASEVISLHCSQSYRVYLMGFTPGFAYLGELPPQLVTPRLATPRTRVPAGSVGIAGAQTGVYPIESPGGWRIIGRTDLRLFDSRRDSPSLLQPGDLVHFYPVNE